MAVLKVQTYETVDAGTYPARVADVVLDENGQFGPQVKAVFELLDEEAAGKTLVGWASAKLSPKSKLYGWVSALLFRGKGIPEGYAVVDTDTLKGQECILVVGVEQKPDGSAYNKVKDVLPMKPTRGAAPRPATATPAPTSNRFPVNTSGYSDPNEAPTWMMEGEDAPF
jgi:hypothetical protein